MEYPLCYFIIFFRMRHSLGSVLKGSDFCELGMHEGWVSGGSRLEDPN